MAKTNHLLRTAGVMVLATLAAALLAAAAGAAPRAFSNPAQITMPFEGAATPYPSQIHVSGQVGKVGDVNVRLNGYTHDFPDNVDVLLVGPTGRNAIIMSDAAVDGVDNINLILNDEAPGRIPFSGPLASGGYQPSNFGAEVDPFPTPAPTPSGNDLLSTFDGTNPNGAWKLYVVDDTTLFDETELGRFARGWRLDVEVDPPAPCTIGGTNRNDTLSGTPNRDVICGFGGNDTLIGLGGNDTLIGGPGNDSLQGNSGRDSFSGGPGRDTCAAQGNEETTGCER